MLYWYHLFILPSYPMHTMKSICVDTSGVWVLVHAFVFGIIRLLYHAQPLYLRRIIIASIQMVLIQVNSHVHKDYFIL